MQPHRSVNDEPIPGYRLIEPLGKGGYGEVWKCHAPGGLFKAIKFVRGGHDLDSATSCADQELRALDHIKTIRHPFLLSTERVEIVAGDLVIVTELADRSLHDLLAEYRQVGQPGIPRHELLGYLREAAEALDLLNQEHGVKHLDVKPRNLFLVGRHVKVADFGMANSLADLIARMGQAALTGLTPLYAAPETFQGKVTLFSDQYSLAATYHELITGQPPFQAKNYNQLVMMVSTQPPDLSRLLPEDRPVVARALAKEPRERFPSCMAFIEALEQVSPPGAQPPKHGSTRIDLPLVDLATTPATATNGSGVYRRRSRILPAVRPVQQTSEDGLAGYQLLESLGRGPSGESWRARGPGGGFYLIRFISLPSSDTSGTMVLDRLTLLRHAALARLQVVSAGPDRVALISEAGQATLWERFRECHVSGLPGIPRTELLAHLARFSDALDELYHQHQIQHLALTPRHFALTGTGSFLVEFGLAELLWLPQGLQPAQLSPRYSAPELFDGLVSDACDQYSLAVIFQELLVGLHPFRNLNARQLGSPKLRGQPDVGLLPGPDRGVMLQALSPDPEKRFRSCREMVLALEDASSTAGQVTVVVPSQSVQGQVIRPAVMTEPGVASAPWRAALDELVGAAGRGHEVRVVGLLPYRHAPGSHIEHRGQARLAAGMARLKLDGFREYWHAEKVHRDERRLVVQIQAKSNLWDRCLGRVPGLQVEVRLGTVEGATGLTPIRVHLLPIDCNRLKADQLLGDLAPTVLGSLQTYLHVQGDKPTQERFPLNQQVHVLVPGTGQSYTGQVRDIGRDGLCFYCPEPLATGPVTLTLNRWASPLTIQVPGRVVDCVTDEKRFEIEVRLG